MVKTARMLEWSSGPKADTALAAPGSGQESETLNWDGTCRAGRLRDTLCPGWHRVRITTSVEGACCGGPGAQCTTGLGTYSAWRHIRCIATKASWATICGG